MPRIPKKVVSVIKVAVSLCVVGWLTYFGYMAGRALLMIHYIGSGDGYFGDKQYALAIERWQMASRYEPRDGYLHFEMSVAYYKLGLIKEAVKECDVSLKLSPVIPGADPFRQGDVLRGRGQYAIDINNYRKTHKL